MVKGKRNFTRIPPGSLVNVGNQSLYWLALGEDNLAFLGAYEKVSSLFLGTHF